MFVKPTDSRSYLRFGSAHPNHTYSGIVYSQSLRLRQIINCQNRLKQRLDELRLAFTNSNYPAKMISNITNKVLKMERKLPKPHNSSNSSIVAPESPKPKPIRLISTFGSESSDLVTIVKEELLASFRKRRLQANSIIKFRPLGVVLDRSISGVGVILRNRLWGPLILKIVGQEPELALWSIIVFTIFMSRSPARAKKNWLWDKNLKLPMINSHFHDFHESRSPARAIVQIL